MRYANFTCIEKGVHIIKSLVEETSPYYGYGVPYVDPIDGVQKKLVDLLFFNSTLIPMEKVIDTGYEKLGLCGNNKIIGHKMKVEGYDNPIYFEYDLDGINIYTEN